MKNPKTESNAEKKPAKKKQAKAKITVAKKLPKVLTEEELEEIEATLIVENILRKYSENIKNLQQTAEDPYNKYLTQETRYDYERLNTMLSEYLDSFIIIGYRPDGELLSMERSKTTRDKIALEKVLQNLTMRKLRNE
jgi:hypothetical protein